MWPIAGQCDGGHGVRHHLGYSRTMPRVHALFGLLAAAFACAQPGRVQAHPTPTTDTAQRLKTALDAAERGQFEPARFPGIDTDPAWPWVEFARLRQAIDDLPQAQAQAFIDRHAGQPVGRLFRMQWLAARAKRSDWNAFRAAWSTQIQSTALRCAWLSAQAAATAIDARWTRQAQAIWSTAERALPKECDAPIARLAAAGGLPPELRWQRLELAAAAWQPEVMRQAADGLDGDALALAERYIAFMRSPDAADTAAWPKSARSRLVASHALARLGKSKPAQAEALLPQVTRTLGLDETERGRVAYQIALWTVASYGPESARRIAAIPAASMDARMREWQMREALHRSDWPAALAAIEAMDAEQRGDSRWTYFQARLNALLGKPDTARALYQTIADRTDFHGFLAADALQRPYTLCPWKLDDDARAQAAVAREPALIRAFALFRAGRRHWAELEWRDALSRFDPKRRRLAVRLAQAAGWFDRGVFGLVNVDGKRYPDELRLYALRFPLPHQDLIRREAAKNRLDPAWVAAEIRAESLFDPHARSPANAIGLMQILPSTGVGVAKKIGLPWAGAASLYDARTNIALGTAYLRQLLDRNLEPYQAIASYNAGPAPVNRWIGQRPAHEPAFWIETISYKETRDYVARVLAFSTIYDWRLTGSALPVSQRMRGAHGAERKAFVCPPARP